MGELGSIFDGAPAAGASGPRGPDVKVRAPVRASMIERGEEVLISVPERVSFEDDTVPRRCGPGDRPGEVRLHLSPQLNDGVTLRLRGQGGEHPESGLPGDLLVTIEVVAAEEGGNRTWLVVAAVAVLGAAAATWWIFGS